LENKKLENYAEIVEQLLSSYCALGCTISCNLTWIFSRKIWEPSLTSTVEGAVRLYPEWKERYNGKWNSEILADYCWMLVQEKPTEDYKRQKMIQ
jgi:hypothetical protein